MRGIGFVVMVRMLTVVLLVIPPGGGLLAREVGPGPAPDTWEAEVKPPPPGEWIENMPGRRVPRDMPAYVVRAFYLVPSNRTAMPGAVERIQSYLLTMQEFYREQMERNGFGSKTISLEMGGDGIKPVVHVVNGLQTDDFYRADPWARVAPAAQNAGLPVWAPRQVWLGIFEGHVMKPDGSLDGIYNGGATGGSGDDGGLGILSSNALASARNDLLTSSAAYDGTILPDLGPYPMVFGRTGGAGEGRKMGEFSSCWYGAIMHEVGHGLGLMHDVRNDMNFNGNLMGNGFRGIRQWMFPAEDFSSETRLSYANAMQLNLSRYFNPPRSYTDNTKPAITVSNAYNVGLVDGKLPVRFSASDGGGLAFALLILNGEVAGQVALSGTTTSTAFLTPYFSEGTNAAVLWVYDQQGNKQAKDFTVSTLSPTGNRAPKPLLTIAGHSVVATNVPLEFSLQYSMDTDSDYNGKMYSFDLDGEPGFETNEVFPAFQKTVQYSSPGVVMTRGKVTDAAGASSISEPIPVRVVVGDSHVADWTLY